jgi:hypothetical protein
MYMVMFVLDDPGRLDAVLQAWEEAGSRGATILESTGIQRRRKKILPMRYVFQTVGNIEESHYTLLAIVESDEVVRACLQATERLVGELDNPRTPVIASAALIVLAATQLAKYGDVIALRTGLGGMFVGVLLMAGATSLPEVLTTISSINQGVPNLAAGNLFGSNMFNMFLLAVLDLVHRKERLLRKAAMRHALSGSLTVFLIGLVVFMVMADIKVSIAWIGVDSLLIILAYMIAMRKIQKIPTTASYRLARLRFPHLHPL